MLYILDFSFNRTISLKFNAAKTAGSSSSQGCHATRRLVKDLNNYWKICQMSSAERSLIFFVVSCGCDCAYCLHWCSLTVDKYPTPPLPTHPQTALGYSVVGPVMGKKELKAKTFLTIPTTNLSSSHISSRMGPSTLNRNVPHISNGMGFITMNGEDGFNGLDQSLGGAVFSRVYREICSTPFKYIAIKF